MVMNSAVVVAGIKPNLSILGDTQNFIFTPNDGFFGVQTLFAPTPSIPSRLHWQFENAQLAGYRFTHFTYDGDTVGTFKFQTFINGSTISEDILTLSETGTVFNKPAAFPAPILPTDAVNLGFLNAYTFTVSRITDFISAVSAFRLDQFQAPTVSLNLNSQKIINLATPMIGTDGVNKTYADTMPIAPSRITGYPSSSNAVLRGDGTWGTPNLVPIAALAGYPSSSSSFLRGDGIWTSPVMPVIDINSGTSGQLNISRIQNYPANSNYFLRGDGVWATPSGSSVDINSGTTGQLNISRLQSYPATSSYVLRGDGSWNYPSYVPITSLAGYPSNSSVFLRGDGAWAIPSGGGGSFGSSEINVNTDGGSYNWLRKSNITKTGAQVYGLNSNAFIVESNSGESAGIGFDGGADQCTIWTAGDSGTLLNIQDEDASNSRLAYVATSGAWTVVSSKKRKHSIRDKANNNVLDRLLNLSVKTYGYTYTTTEDDSEKKKLRIEKKSNKMATGLILEDVFKIFPNCIPDYDNRLFSPKADKPLILEDEIKDVKNSGIDYNVLVCYLLMGFQEYVRKTDQKILALQSASQGSVTSV